MSHVPLPPRQSPSTTTHQPPIGRVKRVEEVTIDLDLPQVQAAIQKEVAKKLKAVQDTQTILSTTSIRVAAGQYVYVAKVALAGSTLAGWSFFTHEKQFAPEDFAAKVTEACKIVGDTRIVYRRGEMAKGQVRVPNPQELNERMFQSDVAFFEGVMADKWMFHILKVTIQNGSIEPTVKVKMT